MRLRSLILIGALLLTNGCGAFTTLRTHPDFENRKKNITSIAVLPPVVSYGRQTPSAGGVLSKTPVTIGKEYQIMLGRETRESDPELQPIVQKNIENACRKLLRNWKYPIVDSAQAESLLTVDPQLESALQKTLSEVTSTVYNIRETNAGHNLNLSMGSECAYLGQRTGASHLLFAWASGWETSKGDKVASFVLSALLDTKEVIEDEGLYLAIFIVEASTGEVIWYNDSDQPGNKSTPHYWPYTGTKTKDADKVVLNCLKPFLKGKK